MGLKLITPAASMAVSLELAKTHLRVDGTTDDEYITMLVNAATGQLEKATNRAIGIQTFKLTLSGWPTGGKIVLPNPPLVSVEQVQYVDTAGTLQTLDPTQYIVNDDEEPATITPAPNAVWPETEDQSNAVTIDYAAGYAVPPEAIKAAILLVTGHWYENREAVITGTIATDLPLAVQYIVDEFSVRRFILP